MDGTPSYHPFVHKILNCKQSESLIYIYILYLAGNKSKKLYELTSFERGIMGERRDPVLFRLGSPIQSGKNIGKSSIMYIHI